MSTGLNGEEPYAVGLERYPWEDLEENNYMGIPVETVFSNLRGEEAKVDMKEETIPSYFSVTEEIDDIGGYLEQKQIVGRVNYELAFVRDGEFVIAGYSDETEIVTNPLLPIEWEEKRPIIAHFGQKGNGEWVGQINHASSMKDILEKMF